MKTINQSVEVAFRAVELKEAMIVAPLMDSLRDSILKNKKAIKYESLSKEDREKFQRVWPDTFGGLNPTQMESIYNLLLKFGFCSTSENDTISEDEVVLKEKSN